MYFAADEFDRLVRAYTEVLLRQPIARYARHYEEVFRSYLRWSRLFARLPFARMSRSRLAQSAEELFRRFIPFSDLQFLAFVVLEGPATEVERIVQHRPDGAALLASITTPYRQTVIQRAHMELLRIAARRWTVADIDAYVRRYGWIRCYEFIDAPWTKKDIIAQIRGMQHPQEELYAASRRRRAGLRRYAEFVATIKDARFRKMVQISHAFAYLKEMRDDYRRHAYFLVRPFWAAIARTLSLTIEESNFFMWNELIEVIRSETGLDRAMLRRRQQGYALRLENGMLSLVTGARALARVQREVVVSPKAGRVVQGKVAQHGKAVGRARIIFHKEEFHTFRKGDVLVTTMTHPEFMGILRQASAIVTDEGGITCHAAIVARELEKPCIISTNNATRIFKDGDLLEVDAEIGVVRRLRAAKSA